VHDLSARQVAGAHAEWIGQDLPRRVGRDDQIVSGRSIKRGFARGIGRATGDGRAVFPDALVLLMRDAAAGDAGAASVKLIEDADFDSDQRRVGGAGVRG
jgi:hypothetical protein